MDEDGKCDEERTLLVRVRPGKDQAEVMFLNNITGDGWEGPFGLDIPIQSLLDFDQSPSRRVAMSEDLPSKKGKEEAQSSETEGSSSSPRRDQMKGKSSPSINISPERGKPDWQK